MGRPSCWPFMLRGSLNINFQFFLQFVDLLVECHHYVVFYVVNSSVRRQYANIMSNSFLFAFPFCPFSVMVRSVRGVPWFDANFRKKDHVPYSFPRGSVVRPIVIASGGNFHFFTSFSPSGLSRMCTGTWLTILHS